MDPEEPFVPPVAMTLPNSTSGVLVKELANHGLGDSMDNGWVCRYPCSIYSRAICSEVPGWRDGAIVKGLRAIDKYTMIGRH
jgi:hypothetical protein